MNLSIGHVLAAGMEMGPCMAELCIRLLRRATAAGQVWLNTAASRVSRPVFEMLGMQVVEREDAARHGILFERFRMSKLLV